MWESALPTRHLLGLIYILFGRGWDVLGTQRRAQSASYRCPCVIRQWGAYREHLLAEKNTLNHHKTPG